MIDEKIFPEEGFPTMAELTGGEPQPAGFFPENTPAPPAEKPAAPAENPAPAGLQKGETPWLDFIRAYPKYATQPLPEGLSEAVAAGEEPLTAYLRLENARLERDLQLLRTEKALRASCLGSVKSAAAPAEPDDFAKGLLLG